VDAPVWGVTVFTTSRDRRAAEPRAKPLLSDEHILVDHTLIKA
jgi:hypothetical protein